MHARAARLSALAPGAAAAAASPSGTLAQLAGAGGCASRADRARLHGRARPATTPRAVALSPDGLSLYVAAAAPASVTSFSVAPGNGLLQQLNLGAGCLASVAQDGCGTARALEGASAIAVSPDNLHVYVASATAGSVTSFARQPNGSLVQLAGVAGCISATPVAGCSNGLSLGGADALAISPDGRFVYVAGGTADSLLVFSRDAATGRLTQLAGAAGCLRAEPQPTAPPVTGLDGPAAIAIAPDGTSLYVASTAGTLTAFQRDVQTGALTQLPAGAGCLSDGDLAGCTAVGGLARASALAITPDGHTLIAAGTDDDAVLSFRRDPVTGALARVSCVSGSTATAGCTPSTLIGGPRALLMRATGLQVWVAASRADSIVTLQIDPLTGTLTPTPGLGGCLRLQASAECRAARALDDPRALASNADGSHVYAVSAQSDGIAVLGPQVAPNCLRVRTTTLANRAHSVVLACSDPNGDKIALTIGQPAEARTHQRARQGDREHPLHAGPGLHRRGLVHLHRQRRPRHECARRRDDQRQGAGKGARGAHPHRTHASAARRAHPRARGMPTRRDRSLPGRRALARRRPEQGLRLLAGGASRDGARRHRCARGDGSYPGSGRGHGARPVAARHDRQADDPDPAVRTGFKSRVLRSVGSERGGLIAGSQARLSLVKSRLSARRSPWLRALRAARVAAAVGAGRTAPGPHRAGRSGTAERHATFETSSKELDRPRRPRRTPSRAGR